MPNQSPHHFYHWQGSAYDIGFQHGTILKNPIIAECKKALDHFVHASGLPQSQFLDRFRQIFEPWFTQHAPRTIDEIHGMANGAGVDFSYAFFAAVRDGAKINPSSPATTNTNNDDKDDAGCTAIYCSGLNTQHGTPFIGQNKDANAPLDRYRIMRRAYDDGLTTITLNYPGWIANIGMSSHGLGWTGNSLHGLRSSRKPEEIVPYSLLRAVIAQSATIDQVNRAIEQFPTDNCCMMVADAHNRAICLECVHDQRQVQDISNRVFGHANCVLSETLKPYEHAVSHSPSSSQRQRNVQKHLDESNGTIDIARIKTILSDHTDQPGSICLHPHDGEPIATTASFIADLAQQQIHIAIGRPCEHPYDVYHI